MEKVHIFDLEGTRFPAGRRTRVVIGQNGAITGDKFCQGYVVIDPNGKIPEHEHETVESYTIIKGTGRMTVDGETQAIGPGAVSYTHLDVYKRQYLHRSGAFLEGARRRNRHGHPPRRRDEECRSLRPDVLRRGLPLLLQLQADSFPGGYEGHACLLYTSRCV